MGEQTVRIALFLMRALLYFAFYAFGSAARPGAGNSSKIVKHWAVQGGTHNRLYIDEVQPCEVF